MLGIDWSRTIVPDYELISKLEKIVQTNKEFAQVSRKLSDSVKFIPHLQGEETSPRMTSSEHVEYDDLQNADDNRRHI